MRTHKKFFKALMAAEIALFLLTCFSIVFCIIRGRQIGEPVSEEHMLGFIYLFIHLIIIAILFYITIGAYFYKSALLNIVLSDDKGNKSKKALIICVVFAFIFFVLGVYSTLLLFIDNIFLSFFSLGLKLCLMNVGYTVFTISLFLIFFKPIPEEIKK